VPSVYSAAVHCAKVHCAAVNCGRKFACEKYEKSLAVTFYGMIKIEIILVVGDILLITWQV
jgi:hypothetical protein